MKTRVLLPLIWMSLCVFSLPPARAEGLTAQQVVDKSNLAAYYQGDDGRSVVTMTITDPQGRERKREFTILRFDVEDGGEQKYYVYFDKPADVRKTVFMVHKKPGSDDDRWLYLPALDLVRRIAASDKRSSFVGSHFFYEDVSGRRPDEDTHEMVSEDETSYHIKGTPKDPDSVEFASYVVQIDKANFLPLKAVYTDKQGKEYRQVEALQVKDIQGFATVTEAKVTDLLTGGFTVSQFNNVEYNIGLTDDIFTERFLRKAPRQWLKP
ncbi:outer membrane lipoprotein-sorting protein [Omnitrophica bacterium]|nr:outer membrane lipoprotein-sorting protein [Candidatus Omnitrophota bacterium]